jgi:hypothetical protein
MSVDDVHESVILREWGSGIMRLILAANRLDVPEGAASAIIVRL